MTDHPPPAVLSKRDQLRQQIQQDRDHLAVFVQRVSGPVQTLETAHRALQFTGHSLRWLVLAGNVASIIWWMKSRRGPPVAALLGLSMQLFSVLSHRRSVSGPSKPP